MLTAEEKIRICAKCQNRKMTMQKGIVCGLTGEKPQFEENCEFFNVDEKYEEDILTELDGPDVPKSKKRFVSIISFAVSFVIFFCIGYLRTKNEPEGKPMTEREKLEYYITQMNKKLPEKLEGGLWTGISIDGKNVIYDLNFENEYHDDLTEEELSILAMAEKHWRLHSMNTVKNFDVIDLYEYVKGKQYNLVYRCHDASSRYLYTYNVNEEELKRAISSKKYKCPLNDIKTVVDYMNASRPMRAEDGTTYEKVVFNENPYELVYKLTFPYTLAEIQTIPTKELDEWVETDWEYFTDVPMALVNINEYPIIICFCAKNGTEYHRMTISPDKYRKLSGI